jgi:hypothetical protein
MCSVGVSTQNVLTVTGSRITLYHCLLKHWLHCTDGHWSWNYTDTDAHWYDDFSDEN